MEHGSRFGHKIAVTPWLELFALQLLPAVAASIPGGYKMKLLDIFHPYLGFHGTDVLGAANSQRVRTASGVCFDPLTGNILIVEPDPDTRLGCGIYETTSHGVPIGLIKTEVDIDPFGIAIEPNGRRLWLTDWKTNHILVIDRRGRLLDRFEARRVDVNNPGAIALSNDAACLFVSDRSENRVARCTLDGEKLSDFALTPFAGALLRGVTFEPSSGNLLLSFAAKTPESGGRLGEFGIFETTQWGRIVKRIDTSQLGFCALDIAKETRGDRLFAIGREFVLPQTIGDHSHLYVIDIAGPHDNRELNPAVLKYFLRYNNLYSVGGGEESYGKTCRWPHIPVAVFIETLVDMPAEDVYAAFEEWSRASRGKLQFEFVQGVPQSGIVFTQGAHAFSSGTPSAQGTVTVSVSDRLHLPAHPIGSLPREVQTRMARHEIGHAVGFFGHSPRFGIDSMNSIAGYSTQISVEEAAFVEVIYSHPNVTGADIIENAVRKFTEEGST